MQDCTPLAAPLRPAPAARPQRVAIGHVIYSAGSDGIAWRIVRGAVRLDSVDADGRHYAGLALRGDVIGAEALLFGAHAFDASAIADTELEPWLADGALATGDSLLRMLATTERRAADAIALRAGQAIDRVRRLCLLLSRHGEPDNAEITVPELRDMAAITNLTEATVSRAMSHLRRSGELLRPSRRKARVRLDLAAA